MKPFFRSIVYLPIFMLVTSASAITSRDYVYKFANWVNPVSNIDTGPFEIKLSVFFPENWQPTDSRPVLILFHGGSWVSGEREGQMGWAEYFAKRGMVAVMCDYRLGMGVHICIQDARSAVRWVRANAKKLGINPQKTIVGGASAGAHLAACCYTADGLDEPTDETSISCRPDLLFLLCPALTPEESNMEKTVSCITPKLVQRCYPNRFWDSGAPPAIMFYGTKDPWANSGHEFHDRAIDLGLDVECWLARNGHHDYWTNIPATIDDTNYLADRFFIRHGFLTGEPEPLMAGRLFMHRFLLAGEKDDLIAPVAIVEVSSEFSPVEAAVNLIDGSGFSDPQVTLSLSHDVDDGAMWRPAKGEEISKVVFDLCNHYDLTGIHIWNHTGTDLGSGTKFVKVAVSSMDEYDPASLTHLPWGLSVFRGGLHAQNFELKANDVRFVQFTINSHPSGSPANGLAEVRFSGTIHIEEDN